MKGIGVSILAGLCLMNAGAASAQAKVSATVVDAVQDASRPNRDIAADRERKPAETLAFSGVRPGMIVGEFYPGRGYFTRLLSRIVGEKGHVYAVANDRWLNPDAPAHAPFAGAPFANVTRTRAPFGTVDFPARLDLAWITQNYHDLKIAEYGVVDTNEFNRKLFEALKPGGILMVIDHEAPTGTDVSGIEKLHRMERAKVIEEITAAGFKLAGEGKFLRSASDDLSVSIFDPKVRGHTDQYALKFVKPAK